MNQAPPPPDLFVREDVSKPENRVNLALLGLMTITSSRRWFLVQLGLPVDSVIYPPMNVGGGRPDFVVTDGARTAVRCWIEVELAGPDQQQLIAYRASLSEPVLVVCGVGGDLTLAVIAEHLATTELDPQQKLNARVFSDLVALLAGKNTNYSYALPSAQLALDPFLVVLAEHLREWLVSGTPPALPGKVLLSTMTQKGWTLRVYSPLNTTERSVSVLWNQALGRGELRVPSAARLRKYLAKDHETVERYIAFMHELFADVRQLTEGQSRPVTEAQLRARIDELATHLTALAQAG